MKFLIIFIFFASFICNECIKAEHIPMKRVIQDGLSDCHEKSKAKGYNRRIRRQIQSERSDLKSPGFVNIQNPSGSLGSSNSLDLKGHDRLPSAEGSHFSIYVNGRPNSIELLTKHSQSKEVPECPLNSTQLWSGYSLLAIVDANGFQQSQDLGAAGSCVQRFAMKSTLTCITVGPKSLCKSNGKNLWIAQTDMRELPNVVGNEELGANVSRCVVCEVPNKVIAVHSQSSNIPDCPTGWHALWFGYSLVTYSDGHQLSGGQALQSPGSCLENFSSSLFITCNAGDQCALGDEISSSWLAAKGTHTESSYKIISRCRVCLKDSF